MIKDVGRFMHSVDDIKNAHKNKKKGKIWFGRRREFRNFCSIKKSKANGRRVTKFYER